MPARIQSVSAAEVQRVAGKYLRPASLVVVGVGDRAKLESELKKLDLGPVEMRDFEGVPVNPEGMPK